MKTVLKALGVIALAACMYSGGYWHGRIYELYLSRIDDGTIQKTMTWEQFLKRDKENKP